MGEDALFSQEPKVLPWRPLRLFAYTADLSPQTCQHRPVTADLPLLPEGRPEPTYGPSAPTLLQMTKHQRGREPCSRP